jgi:hypothetical protein|uniref:Zinc finger BED domain-containing protein 5 n=1 Tax=Sipha flava TaxID=143950 RepID=A0A2S2QYX9_9HEMI
MKTHFRELRIQLLEYFVTDNDYFSNKWVLNPFDENIVATGKQTIEIHNQIIEFSADKTLQLQFSSQDLNMFWLACRNEYENLVTEVLKTLVLFATSYLYKKRFPSMVV